MFCAKQEIVNPSRQIELFLLQPGGLVHSVLQQAVCREAGDTHHNHIRNRWMGHQQEEDRVDAQVHGQEIQTTKTGGFLNLQNK